MGITRASFILFLGNMAGMGGYYLFQVYMSRSLTPADFGILNALQALFFVAAAPAIIFAQCIAKHFGQRFALKKTRFVREQYFKFFKALIFFCILGLFFFFSTSGITASFLRIEAFYPMFITGLWIFSFYFLQLNQGFLAGSQQFNFMSISLGIQGGFRWIFGVLLVVVGFSLNGALSAQPLAFILAYAVTLYAVFTQFSLDSTAQNESRAETRIDWHQFIAESYPIFLVWPAFMILTNMDMLLVKHYLSPYEAGMYSSLAVLGRGILFLSEAIGVGMFAIGVQENAVRVDNFTTYHRAILLCSIMYVIVITIFMVMPEIIIKVIFGEMYVINAPYVKFISISMALFGMLRIFINFNLARGRRRFILLIYVAVIAEFLLIVFFHSSIQHILLILIAISGSLFITCESIVLVESMRCQEIVQ